MTKHPSPACLWAAWVLGCGSSPAQVAIEKGTFTTDLRAKADTFILSTPVAYSPLGEKCFVDGRSFLLNDAAGQQYSVDLRDLDGDTLHTELVSVHDSLRDILVQRKIISAELESRFFGPGSLTSYRAPRLLRVFRAEGSRYALIRVWAVEEFSEEAGAVLAAFDLLVQDDSVLYHLNPRSLLDGGFGFHPEGLWLSQDSLVISISRSSVKEHGDNPLFAVFKKNGGDEYTPSGFASIDLPPAYSDPVGSYLNSGGFVRGHYMAALMAPLIYDLRSGATSDLCELLSGRPCAELLREAGTHYWLSDALALANGTLVLAYESGPSHFISVVDVQRNAVIRTLRIHGALAFASMAFVADGGLVALTEDQGRLLYWRAGWPK